MALVPIEADRLGPSVVARGRAATPSREREQNSGSRDRAGCVDAPDAHGFGRLPRSNADRGWAIPVGLPARDATGGLGRNLPKRPGRPQRMLPDGASAAHADDGRASRVSLGGRRWHDSEGGDCRGDESALHASSRYRPDAEVPALLDRHDEPDALCVHVHPRGFRWQRRRAPMLAPDHQPADRAAAVGLVDGAHVVEDQCGSSANGTPTAVATSTVSDSLAAGHDETTGASPVITSAKLRFQANNSSCEMRPSARRASRAPPALASAEETMSGRSSASCMSRELRASSRRR